MASSVRQHASALSNGVLLKMIRQNAATYTCVDSRRSAGRKTWRAPSLNQPASLNFHSLLTRREHQTPSNSPRARCALRQMTANPSSFCTCTSSNVEADKWLPSAGSCDGTHIMIARMVNKVARANYCDEPSGEFGLRLRYSILSGGPGFVAWELGRVAPTTILAQSQRRTTFCSFELSL